jgi:hypothetical protein
MVYFQTKTLNLGKFWRVLQRKLLVYFVAIWSILRPFGIFFCHSVYLWYIFPRFGMLHQEKSGNPAWHLLIVTQYDTHFLLSSSKPLAFSVYQPKYLLFGKSWVKSVKFFRPNVVRPIRVASWYIFMPKLPIRLYFGGHWNEKCWYILRPFSNVYSHLVILRPFGNFAAIWYIFPPFWYIVPRKIWQPCVPIVFLHMSLRPVARKSVND